MSAREPPLAPRERRRRTVILCTSFLRNLAIYRAGQTVGAQLLSHEARHHQFWLQMNSNCIDICVLEWCKLFADQNGEHFWRAVVAPDRHAAFENGLLQSVSMSADDFAEYVRDFRRYRDRFIAHLDRDRTMYPPVLSSAEVSVRYFFARVVSEEAAPYDLIGLPSRVDVLDRAYAQFASQVEEIFDRAKNL